MKPRIPAPSVRPGTNRARVLVALIAGAAHADVIARRTGLTARNVAVATDCLRQRGMLEGGLGTFRLTQTGQCAARVLLGEVDSDPVPEWTEEDLEEPLSGDTATTAALRIVASALGRGRVSRSELMDAADRSDRTFRRLLARIREAGFRVDADRNGISIELERGAA